MPWTACRMDTRHQTPDTGPIEQLLVSQRLGKDSDSRTGSRDRLEKYSREKLLLIIWGEAYYMEGQREAKGLGMQLSEAAFAWHIQGPGFYP